MNKVLKSEVLVKRPTANILLKPPNMKSYFITYISTATPVAQEMSVPSHLYSASVMRLAATDALLTTRVVAPMPAVFIIFQMGPLDPSDRP